MKRLIGAIALALVLPGPAGALARAEAASGEPAYRVEMEFGANACWHYEGNAPEYYGRFSSGQWLNVKFGDIAGPDGPIRPMPVTMELVEEGTIFAIGQGDVPQSIADSGWDVFIPKDGYYMVTFEPRAYLGSDVKVDICQVK